MPGPEEGYGSTVAGHEDGPHHELARDHLLRAAGDAIAAEGTAAEEVGNSFSGPTDAWVFQADDEPRRVELAEIPKLITVEEYFVWIDLSEYRETDLQAIGNLVGMNQRVTASARSSWQRPHLDLFGDHFYVSVTVADLNEQARRALARQLDLVVGPNYLISGHKQPIPFSGELLARASHDPDLVRLDSGFMLYIILDELLAYYETLEEQMRGEIEHMQLGALRDSSDEFLEELLHFKRYAFALAQLAQQHHLVFHAFLRPDFPFLSAPELQTYFRDLELRLLRLVDRLESTHQEVNSTFDIYLSHQTHRTNDVMKTLTMVATILFTATFIEGIFGPAFKDLPTHSVQGFIVMLALIAAATGAAFYTFHRRGWM